MYIVQKLNSKSNGELTVDFEYGKLYKTLQEANQECITSLYYHRDHSKKLNKLVGEYFVIVDTERNFQKCWYLFNGEVDYVRANSFEEVETFAYSMANTKCYA